MMKQSIVYLVAAVLATVNVVSRGQDSGAALPISVEDVAGSGHPLLGLNENMFTSVRGPEIRGTRSSTFQLDLAFFSAEGAAAFRHAADILSQFISSPVPIVVAGGIAPLSNSQLGLSRPARFLSDFPGAPRPNVNYPVALANSLAGVDLAPGEADIFATFDQFTVFYNGTDANPTCCFDFVTVALHELLHGLGIQGSDDLSGGAGIFNEPFNIYDVHLRTGGGQSLVDQSFVSNASPALAALFRGGDLFFGSPFGGLALAAPVRLFAPAAYRRDVSIKHLDEGTFPAGDPDSLMTPALGLREAIHHPGSIAVALLADLGWRIGAGPPPAPPAGAPGAPTNLTATATGNTVNMTWNAPAPLFAPPDRAAATGYSVKARVTPGGPVIFDQPVGNTLAFSARGPDGTFILSVAGTNDAGEGPESSTQTVTLPGGDVPPGCAIAPDVPTGLASVIDGGIVTINWIASTGCPATSYVLEAGSAPGGTDLANVDTGSAAATFTANGVPVGTYFVRVRGRNGFATSGASAEVMVVVLGS